jgi:hypothetical protein
LQYWFNYSYLLMDLCENIDLRNDNHEE